MQKELNEEELEKVTGGSLDDLANLIVDGWKKCAEQGRQSIKELFALSFTAMEKEYPGFTQDFLTLMKSFDDNTIDAATRSKMFDEFEAKYHIND